jgi:uncharacterized sulfatase
MKNSLRNLFLLCMVFSFFSLRMFASEDGSMPNVIIVLADDQGYGQWGRVARNLSVNDIEPRALPERYKASSGYAMQAAIDAMPTLDRLAAEGVNFSEAFVSAPVCGPSRASLLTGRHPARLGIYSNPDVSHPGLALGETVLAELFKKNGYRTAAFGKWHLSSTKEEVIRDDTHDYHEFLFVDCANPAQHPLNRGFDYFYGFYSHGTAYYNSPSIFRGFDNVPAEGYLTDTLTEEALQFIRSDDEEPFFIYLAYNAPHIPLEIPPPARYLAPFRSGNPEVDNYYGALAALDHGLGRIEAELKQRGEWGNTLLIYLSDNGAVIDSPQPVNGPYRGYKGLFLEGGVHTPMVISWPDGLVGGQEYANQVSSMDIFPTTLAAAGIELPADLHLDGVNLLPYLRGEEEGLPHSHLIWVGDLNAGWSETAIDSWTDYWRYLKMEFDERPLASGSSSGVKRIGWTISSPPWRLHCVYHEKLPKFHLYNTVNDPGETKDLAAEHPDKVKELVAVYQEWSACLAPPREGLDGWEHLRE